MIRIVALSEVPHHVSQITDWLRQAFGAGTACEFYDSIVRSSLNGAAFPMTVVALDSPLGTAGFWRCDLISRQDLSALYIDKAVRGQGVSEVLQQHVIDFARARAHGQLWLWATFGGYYEHFDWQYQGEGGAGVSRHAG